MTGNNGQYLGLDSYTLSRRKRISFFVASACCAALAIGLSAGMAAELKPRIGIAPRPMVATSRTFHATVTHSLNPHLHASPVTAVKHQPASTSVSTVEVHHHVTHVHELIAMHSHFGWHRWWSYHTFAVHHHGIGTIEGYVIDRSGRPAAGARVVLRKPGGHGFVQVALRHITTTNSAGAFVMFGVRAGKYRVVALHGKERGHEQVAVNPGRTSMGSIKI